MVLPIALGVASRWYGFYHFFSVLAEPMDNLSSQLVSKLRLYFGDRIHPDAVSAYRPRVPLRLYEYEASSACRTVREVLSVLDIDYVSLPCPCESFVDETTANYGRWRLEAEAKGGKAEFPLLEDPNTDSLLYTDEIIPYLWETYGPLCGELDVTVVEGQSLTNRPTHKRALFGANTCTRQTFAEVVLLGCPVPPLKTEVRPNTLDPVFHETFSYGITCAQQALQVTVKDKDYGWDEADACMGKVVIPLGEIISAIALQKHMQVAKASGSQEGSVDGEEAREERRAMQLNSGERVVLDKWYHLEEERPLRRAPLRRLGLLRLRFEFRPREVQQGDMPWQSSYLMSSKLAPHLMPATESLLLLFLLAVLRVLSCLLCLLARPLPSFGRMRIPNRAAERAREMAMADADGAEDDEQAVRDYIASITERQGGLLLSASKQASTTSTEMQLADSASKPRSVSPKGRKTAAAASPRPNLFLNVAKGIGRLMQRNRTGSVEASPRADPFSAPADAVPWGEDVGLVVQVWGFEASPETRRIREMLCCLEVPYVMHNVAAGSDKALPTSSTDADGNRRVPWFVDPSSGYESGDVPEILQYLSDAHATGTCEEDWLALTAGRYWRRVLLEGVQRVLVASLEECRIFTAHLLDRLKEDLMPFIREEVEWSVKETALNIGLANGPADAPSSQQRTLQSPAGASRARSRSRGATPRGTSPGARQSAHASPPGTPIRRGELGSSRER